MCKPHFDRRTPFLRILFANQSDVPGSGDRFAFWLLTSARPLPPFRASGPGPATAATPTPVRPARRRLRPAAGDDSTPIPRSDPDRSPFEPDRRPTGVEPIRGAGPTRPVATSAAGWVGSGDRTVEAGRRRNDLDCPERVEISRFPLVANSEPKATGRAIRVGADQRGLPSPSLQSSG